MPSQSPRKDQVIVRCAKSEKELWKKAARIASQAGIDFSFSQWARYVLNRESAKLLRKKK